MELTVFNLSKTSWQLLDDLAWNLIQAFMPTPGCFVITCANANALIQPGRNNKHGVPCLLVSLPHVLALPSDDARKVARRFLSPCSPSPRGAFKELEAPTWWWIGNDFQVTGKRGDTRNHKLTQWALPIYPPFFLPRCLDARRIV